MKKYLSLLLAVLMALGCLSFASAEDRVGADPALVEAAKAEGELVVYGSCEEPYLAAACQQFEKLYGIKIYL